MKKSNLDLIPSRIKYYLLDWKDRNMSEYIRKYGEVRLRDLSLPQMHELFYYANRKDGAKLEKIIIESTKIEFEK